MARVKAAPPARIGRRIILWLGACTDAILRDVAQAAVMRSAYAGQRT
jgi:hypothetical protein